MQFLGMQTGPPQDVDCEPCAAARRRHCPGSLLWRVLHGMKLRTPVPPPALKCHIC